MADTPVYTVGGTVPEEGVYITRAADEELFAACEAGVFAYILAPRQVGKSSVMVRTAQRLRDADVQPVIIDLTQLGANPTPEQWYLGILVAVADQLMLETEVTTWWNDHQQLGFTDRWVRFFREVVLAEVPSRIVIFVDEIDTTLSLNFTDDFYAAIRSLSDERARHPDLKRLSFVLLGVATPSDLIRDPKRTPFNIGQRIELNDWTLEECTPLQTGLGVAPEQKQQVLAWIHSWTNGHPFLTQRLCSVIAKNQTTNLTRTDLDAVVQRTFLGVMSEQDNNILFVRDMLLLQKSKATNTYIDSNLDLSSILGTYKTILHGKKVYDENQSPTKTHLKLAGAVRKEANILKVRNKIYADIFDAKWVRHHLPINLRRQRQTRRIASFSAAVFLLALMPLYLFAVSQRNNAISSQQTAEVDRSLADNSRKTAEVDRSLAVIAQQTAEADKADAVQSAQQAQSAQVDAEYSRQLAEASALAFQSQVARDNNPNLAVQLALAATERSQSPQIEDALRQSIPYIDAKYQIDSSYESINTRFSPDGSTLAWTSSRDGRIRLADINAITQTDPLRLATDDIIATNMYWNYQGNLLLIMDSQITTSKQQIMVVWNVETDKEVSRIIGYTQRIKEIAWSWDGRKIVIASEDGTAQIWDVATGKSLVTFRGHQDIVRSVAWSVDDTRILSAGNDGTARIWDATTGQEELVLEGHNSFVNGARWSPDNTLVLTTSDDGTARVWDAQTGVELHQIVGYTLVDSNSTSPIMQQGAWNADGTYASMSYGDTFITWNPATNSTMFVQPNSRQEIVHVSWNHTGTLIALVVREDMIRVLDARTLDLQFSINTPKNSSWSLDWSKDDRYLVTSSGDDAAVYYTQFSDVVAAARERMLEPLSPQQLEQYLSGLLPTAIPPTPAPISDPYAKPVPADLFLYIGKMLIAQEWTEYITNYNFGANPPTQIIFRSTAIPSLSYARNPSGWVWDSNEQGLSEEQIRDKRTKQLDALRDFDRVQLGWDRGSHLYIDDKFIGLFTPMNMQGIHSKECNGYRDEQGILRYSLGFHLVGYFEEVQPAGTQWENTKMVLGTLSQKLDIAPRELIRFGRDCGKPNSPGSAITDEWVWSEVEQWIAEHPFDK